ncbi:MAG TPA: hypothetical protein VF519_11840 [Mycobacteriales bacterium]
MVRVVAVVALGFATNKLSDAVELTWPMLVLGVPLALVLALTFERRRQLSAPRGDTTSELVVFCLVALLLGAVAAGTFLLPILEQHVFLVAGGFVFNYELGAGAVLALLAGLGASRRRSPVLVTAFVVWSVTGMTLVLTTFRRENDPVSTFVGWTVGVGLFSALVYLWPVAVRVFSDFWGSDPEAHESVHTTLDRESDTPPPPASTAADPG